MWGLPFGQNRCAAATARPPGSKKSIVRMVANPIIYQLTTSLYTCMAYNESGETGPLWTGVEMTSAPICPESINVQPSCRIDNGNADCAGNFKAARLHL